ncbi:MAG: glycosyltransferase family 4 protein [Burkholderiales bacterium]|nr:glycosyltransferase family 4 protein [Burkholderiales bacterium]
MAIIVLGFAVSLLLTLIVVRVAKRRELGHDSDLSGPQKFHSAPVPRLGGVGIVLGLLASAGLLLFRLPSEGLLGLALLACAVPAFGAGLAEDLTRRVSPRRRLVATALSAALASLLLDATIRHTSIPGLDALVSVTAGALALTMLAVAGVANSVNIIDGFNGLASMCVVLMLAALAYVGFQVGDAVVGTLALAGIGAVLGFFVWNYPAGLIFLGDGGAYFLGFYVAELSILLIERSPGDVSPLFPLVVCIYPVFETLFSVYRRRFLRAMPPHMPDGIHLHSLIYRRVLRWAVGSRSARSLTRRNSMTAPYLWMLCMSSVLPAVLFYDDTAVLAGLLLLFGLTYTGLYWRIVRFRSPRWLRARWLSLPSRFEADNEGT